MPTPPPPHHPDLARQLGLFDAISVVVGTTIGSGIFLVPNLIARQLPSLEWIIAVWIFSGVLSFFGALAYAELGAMLPATGGQYVFLREAFGPLPAFLCGWTYLLVIISAAIGWLGVVFTIYLSHFLPIPKPFDKLLAAAFILTLTAINYCGVQAGVAVQRTFTLLKVGGIVLLIGAALLSPINQWTAPAAPSTGSLAAHFGIAMIACLLSLDGWVTISFIAGEMKRPERNVPLALALGLGAVVAIYISLNAAYLKIFTVPQAAAAERIAAQVAGLAIGPAGASLVAAIIVLSITGSVNGWILTAPRIYFAQARDGLFFRPFAEIHPRFRTPSHAIALQGLFASLMALTGTYETLASFAMFATWLFYGFTAFGLILLRRRSPGLARPFKMPGYPVTPILFCLTAAAFIVNTLITDTVPSLIGLALIAAGVPVYLLRTRKTSSLRIKALPNETI